MMRKFLILLSLLPLLTFGYSSPGKAVGFVNDFAHLLSPAAAASLEETLATFSRETGHEVSVVTIPTHGSDETIETYAERLFQEWGIGREKEDDGLLLLIARDDREMRLEVGYGLEPIITDIESGHIISDVLRPAFQEGDYDKGVRAAINRIMDDIGRGAPQDTGSNSPSFLKDYSNNVFSYLFGVFGTMFIWFLFGLPIFLASILGRSKSWWAGGVLGGILGVIFFSSILAIVIMVAGGLLFDYIVSRTYKKSKDRGMNPPWWIGGGGSGRGGGGFGGFGGGSSGGGGASGSW